VCEWRGARPTLFFEVAPVLDPRPEFATPHRISLQPAGGPSPAGAKFLVFSILDFGFSIVSQPRLEAAKSKIFD
jgi:hypothetical protein